jgi:hypothetical protein
MRAAGDSSADENAPSVGRSFTRSMSLFWLYTLLRFGLWALLWLVFWLVGLSVLVAAAIAVVVSIPLSWLLLSRPREALAANIEERVNRRVRQRGEFDARLAADADAARGHDADRGHDAAD